MRYWIRHDRPELPDHICYGWLDLPLAVPVEQTLQALPELPHGLPIFTSPLQRCRLLAESLAETLSESMAGSIEIECLTSLQEVHFGRWEGVRWDDVPRDELDAWAADPFGYQFPQGESVPAFIERVRLVLNSLPADAIIITHAGVIRAALHLSQSITLAEAFDRRIDFAQCLRF
ncbi:histidine phosphatase family protein [Nitrincola alkalilacustris]|uniref:histidine phosphatase family protein n=1 Tax=Nitrincola alkalilacustris TaxID=1571224 RepID=UPI00124CA5AF|nr:histidine phosphatase family protein [Nitrincola alkalilacustris]